MNNVKHYRGKSFCLVHRLENEQLFSPITVISHSPGNKVTMQIIRDIDFTQMSNEGDVNSYTLYAYPRYKRYYEMMTDTEWRNSNMIRLIDFNMKVTDDEEINLNFPNCSIKFNSRKILDKNSNIEKYNYYITHPIFEFEESFINSLI